MKNTNNRANLYKPTALFSKKLDRIKNTDPVGYHRIKIVMDRLLMKPNDADGKMRGVYGGRYKKYVGRRDYRIIYYYCDLCRKENRRLKNSHRVKNTSSKPCQPFLANIRSRSRTIEEASWVNTK